jgi:hypothetical protein
MAGRGDRNGDSGIGNRTFENPEEEQDPEALSDVGKDKDKAELEGLAEPDPPGPGLDKLGLDPAAPRLRPLPPIAPLTSPPPSPQPSPLPPQPQHQPQPPILAAQANGNQIALLPTFDGEAGSDVDMWIAVFLRMARQFNWIEAVITAEQDTRLASVAKNKLIGKTAFWLDTERRGGVETDIWDTTHSNLAAVPPRPHARIGLKDGLIAMFKVDISQLEATEAVMDLVIKSNETINVFYVRVKWAMEVKKHSISMADKALAPYIADRDQDLFTFFLAGVPSKYWEFAVSGENPPTDPTTLRKRCAQLEAMQSRTKRIAALAAETNEEKEEESSIELLTKEIAVF